MAPLSAGQRLRRDLNSALKRAARDADVPSLEFTEIERHLIDIAVGLADFAEVLRVRRDAAESDSAITRLSAELRHCQRDMIDTLARLDLDLVGKAPQHQRAAQRCNRPGRPGAAAALRGA